jgi:predicted XRE-type DNA-binding protein
MKQKLEVVRGSGNVYRDLGYPDADALQLKAKLAAEITIALERRKLSVRQAASVTGFGAAEFSRIRNARLKHFTIERLMTILSRLDRKVTVTLEVTTRRRATGQAINARP